MAHQDMKKPDCLYSLAVASVVHNFKRFKGDLSLVPAILPDSILFDVYFKLYQENRLCLLGGEFCEISLFNRMLRITDRRLDLHRSYQALMDHDAQISKDLCTGFRRLCLKSTEAPQRRQIELTIDQGLKLGVFLSDAGWYADSETILVEVGKLFEYTEESPLYLRRKLECCHVLLHAQTAYCNFAGAAASYKLAEELVKQLQDAQIPTNLARLYAEFSTLHFSRSEYDEAYAWSLKALRELVPGLPIRTTIDVLRQVARSCVVKREFKKAGLLAKQAVYLTRATFGADHPKFSDCLLDLGYYLLNSDSIRQSVAVYKIALAIRRAIFGKDNLQVAIAHEDLAYALYVQEYSSGNFADARKNAEKAISMMDKLLPNEHVMQSSGKRVKALILEEIALDIMDGFSTKYTLLEEAEALHLFALKLAMDTFGERNVQTAKHFGNLGRLYQSMQKFEEAEAMHLKAIAIKEELLGLEDYEVGLSVGHLASLYNYHMKKHYEAMELYFRSVHISLKLFGPAYSGLEYDYRGLVLVYQELADSEKVSEYSSKLGNWKLNRDLLTQKEEPSLDLDKTPCSISDITDQFVSIN